MHTEKQLVNILASLVAYKTAYSRNILPGSYYNQSAYGCIPRNAWLLHNAEYTIKEIQQELNSRQFTDYGIFIELSQEVAV